MLKFAHSARRPAVAAKSLLLPRWGRSGSWPVRALATDAPETSEDSEADDRGLQHVAIVGSGPAGFYFAKYLVKQHASVRVDIIDALPTPFGLVRSGVAPDHPEVKSVDADFHQVATHPRIGYLGNVEIGSDVPVARLRQFYDAVVLAHGAEGDRELGIEGEALKGVTSARQFVQWYNGHPKSQKVNPALDATDAVIIGQGNVAIDCARVLARHPDELATTDITEKALAALEKSAVRRITLAGRRGPAQLACTIKELRELTRVCGARVGMLEEEVARGRTGACADAVAASRMRTRMQKILDASALGAAEFAAGPSEAEVVPRTTAAASAEEAEADAEAEAAEGRAAAPPVVAPTQVSEAEAAGAAERAPRDVRFRFFLRPVALLPSAEDPERVGAVRFERTSLEGPAGDRRAVGTGQFEEVPCGLVLRSVGYRTLAMEGVPFDAEGAVVPNDGGRVADHPGLYVTGWAKRGPSGIIGTNIEDAKETLAALLADAEAGLFRVSPAGAEGDQALPDTPSETAARGVREADAAGVEDGAEAEDGATVDTDDGGERGMAGVVQYLEGLGRPAHTMVSWSGYENINDFEVEAGAKVGKPREKLTSTLKMLRVACGSNE